MLCCIKEDYGPHKLVTRCLEQLYRSSNYKYSVTSMLLPLRRHLRQHGDSYKNIFLFHSSVLTIDIIREEIIEYRLDNTFQFDKSTEL